MRYAFQPRLGSLWAQARQRFGPRAAPVEGQGVLCVSVSELGWYSTVIEPNEPEHSEGEELTEANAPLSPVDVLGRAVRAVSKAQRERIGSVRLLVADPAFCIVDNRSTRIKTTDPTLLRQAGAHELGTTGALYAFRQFGQSSEHEIERGAYVFAQPERVQDYFVALENLALKLVEIVPAPLLELSDPTRAAFVLLDMRGSSSSLLLADPETGTVLSREIACGTRTFAAALAEATSVSLKEAEAGLARRPCFRPDAGAEGARAPLTGTERALTAVLLTLRQELTDSVEHFVYQRLATAPVCAFLAGNVGHIRGLREWIGNTIGLPTEELASAHSRFVTSQLPQSVNLLESAPAGLLKIGKTEYRFVAGRFRQEGATAPQPAPRPARTGDSAAVKAPKRAAISGRQLALPIGLAVTAAVALWLGAGDFIWPAPSAPANLASVLAEDAVLRTALVQRTRAAMPPAGEPTLYWTDKLAAIARALPDGIRLTKLSVTGTTLARDDKLSIEGETAANADHISRITRFLERLSADAGFMRNVTGISFDGAQTAEGAARSLVNFSISVGLGPNASLTADRAAASGAGG